MCETVTAKELAKSRIQVSGLAAKKLLAFSAMPVNLSAGPIRYP